MIYLIKKIIPAQMINRLSYHLSFSCRVYRKILPYNIYMHVDERVPGNQRYRWTKSIKARLDLLECKNDFF